MRVPDQQTRGAAVSLTALCLAVAGLVQAESPLQHVLALCILLLAVSVTVYWWRRLRPPVA